MSASGRILRLRKQAGSEDGFTLMELLVVMLILGILMSIALVAFLNQREKADDTQAKSNARTLMTAMETCGNDKGGSYAGCTITVLRAIEKAIPQSGSGVDATSTTDTWTVTAVSTGDNTFQIRRGSDGSLERPCIVPPGNDRGGCPPGNSW